MKKLRIPFASSTLLWAVYLLMVLLCTYLTATSEFSWTSVGINVSLFLVVGCAFFFASRSLVQLSQMKDDLESVCATIRSEYKANGVYLWPIYRGRSDHHPFENNVFTRTYADFVTEMELLGKSTNGTCKCSISDYFNPDYVDTRIRKNLLNQIPGLLTGLGILGTFIGLSFGLQSFNTGSASEISDSIAPLMNGIKVAFHTSVYGLVFSLTFTFIYKSSLENVYRMMDNFTSCFDRYVLGDGKSDNEAALQRAILDLPDRISFAMRPSFHQLNDTLASFVNNMSSIQVEGVSAIVQNFIKEMNASLNGSFNHLGQVIEETCRLQKQNSDYMQDVLSGIGSMTDNISKINALSMKTVESMTGYVSSVERLQASINDYHVAVIQHLGEHRQMESELQSYIGSLIGMAQQVNESTQEYTRNMAAQISAFQAAGQTSAAEVRKYIDLLAAKADEFSEFLCKTAQQQIDAIHAVSSSMQSDLRASVKELSSASKEFSGQLSGALNVTFNAFDKCLADITGHLSGTISQVDATTKRVPEVVAAAYDGMELAFSSLQDKTMDIVRTLEVLQCNLQKQTETPMLPEPLRGEA